MSDTKKQVVLPYPGFGLPQFPLTVIKGGPKVDHHKKGADRTRRYTEREITFMKLLVQCTAPIVRFYY